MAFKKRPPFNQNSAIRSALRRTFSRSPIVREVLMAGRREVPRYNKDGTRAKKDAVQYQCEVCGKWVGSTHVEVDHINPVIDNNIGFVDWNTFVARLFCGKENLQRICDDCHDKKTQAERDIAKERRRREKEATKSDETQVQETSKPKRRKKR